MADDITPHESEIQWHMTADRLWAWCERQEWLQQALDEFKAEKDAERANRLTENIVRRMTDK